MWTPAKVSGKKIENRKILLVIYQLVDNTVSRKVTYVFLLFMGYV